MEKRKPLDSYQKFTNDVFASHSDELFVSVHPVDRDDVKVQFARLVAEASPVSDIRVFPLHMTDKFRENRSGKYFSTQIKGREGRIYWAGFKCEVQE